MGFTMAEKTKILDEYLKLPGKGNRKYAIYALNMEGHYLKYSSQEKAL